MPISRGWAQNPNLEDNKITYRFCSELREEILISRAEPVTDSV
jgi:hypothetical protein